MRRSVLLAAIACAAWPAMATAAPAFDPAIASYHQRIGAALPHDAVLRGTDGQPVTISGLSDGAPMILVLGYFHCRSLCGLIRQDLIQALRRAQLRAGPDYALAVISIDPTETATDARTAEAADVSAYRGDGTDRAWHYLTGSPEQLRRIAEAVGFDDRADSASGQFMHPAGIVVATPGGVVSGYLLGVGYTPVDLRAALGRAAAGELAVEASPVLLLCFHFDPTTGRYTLSVMKLMRLAALLTVAATGLMLWLLFRRDRRDA